MAAKIPIHDFIADSRDSILFKYLSLGELTSYDFSLPHRHNYYEIFFFSKGGGSHLIDFKEYPVLGNSVHFVSPGQVHVIKRSADSYGTLLLFSRDFFHTAADTNTRLFNYPFLNNSQFPVLSITSAEYAGFEPILTQIRNEHGDNHELHREILRSCVKVILLKCLQLFDDKYPDHKLKQGSVFNSFRELVEKEYRVQRQPASYAAKLAITEKKLNAVCKDNTGENVSDFIKNRIQLEAKRLLINTDHSVKEIASFLGFDDPSYFNRFFRANTGITAGDFRKSGK